MKQLINLITAIVILLLLYSCKKNEAAMEKPPASVYKLRGDYINNVCIGLSDDRTRVTSFPSPDDLTGNPDFKPYLVNDEYYWDYNYGVASNDVFLTLTKKEWGIRIRESGFPSKDSMMKLIIDPDPFLEYYVDNNRILNQKDSSFLNGIIERKELDKYLKRIK